MNISTASVLVPTVSQSHPYPPGNPPSPASRSDPGSYKVRPFVMGPGAFESLCAPSPSIEFLFYQLLCSSRTPALFGHQTKWPGHSSIECQFLRLRALTGGSEFSLLWENICHLIILQSVIQPPKWYGT